MSLSGVIGNITCNHAMRLMFLHENDGQQVASTCPRCRRHDFRKMVCNLCGHTNTDMGNCKCYAETYYNPTHVLVRNDSGKAIEVTQDNGADSITAQEQQECS